MSAQSKMTAARTSLVLEQPFFGALALSLPPVEDLTCDTAYVNGKVIGYNPTFIESLNHDQITALVAHEVMHVALGHPWRRDGRSMKGWNIACNLAINGDLAASGFKLPPDGYFPDDTQKGKSAEWIFARMGEEDPDGTPQGGSGQGNGQGTPQPGQGTPDPFGEVRDAPTGQDVDGSPAPTEQDWKQLAAAAMQQAKMQGKMPAGLARQVSEALKPRIDIRSLLLRFFSERSTGDYSWRRPNPRYIARGLYLPCLESKSLGELAVMVDTSGSVDQTSLAYARGILESVIEECDPAGVTLYFADAKVCHVERMEKGDPLTWEPKGGGGTDFRPALKAIEDEEIASCIVCITDLEGTFPESCGIPVLWLATTDHIAPFGETVPIDR